MVSFLRHIFTTPTLDSCHPSVDDHIPVTSPVPSPYRCDAVCDALATFPKGKAVGHSQVLAELVLRALWTTVYYQIWLPRCQDPIRYEMKQQYLSPSTKIVPSPHLPSNSVSPDSKMLTAGVRPSNHTNYLIMPTHDKGQPAFYN
jgi:hypothetical protein